NENTTAPPPLTSPPSEIDAWLLAYIPSIVRPTTPLFELSPLRFSDAPPLNEILSDKSIYDVTLRIPYPYTPAHADQFLRYAMEINLATVAARKYPLILALRDTEEWKMALQQMKQ
ncbi:hypothetical protein HDU96_003507, partial [Phlyctochytrium bullatum]